MNQINEKVFSDEILKSENLVVVDFWAEWCGPCRMLKPVLDELSEEYNDVKIVGLDVDTYPNVSVSQGIRGIPTLGFYKNGIMVDRLVGAVPKSRIKEKIDILNQ
jgi:thioredoxin 1